MAGVVHTLGLYQWAAGLMIPSNTFKAILLTGHTPDKANEFVSDIVSDEIAETYTRPTVSSVAVSYESGKVKIDAGDIDNVMSLTDEELVSHVAIYKEVGTDATNVLLATVGGVPKFTGDGAGGSEDFPIIWNALGFANLLT